MHALTLTRQILPLPCKCLPQKMIVLGGITGYSTDEGKNTPEFEGFEAQFLLCI